MPGQHQQKLPAGQGGQFPAEDARGTLFVIVLSSSNHEPNPSASFYALRDALVLKVLTWTFNAYCNFPLNTPRDI